MHIYAICNNQACQIISFSVECNWVSSKIWSVLSLNMKSVWSCTICWHFIMLCIHLQNWAGHLFIFLWWPPSPVCSWPTRWLLLSARWFMPGCHLYSSLLCGKWTFYILDLVLNVMILAFGHDELMNKWLSLVMMLVVLLFTWSYIRQGTLKVLPCHMK